MARYTEIEKAAVEAVAQQLSVPYEWLYNLIRFETAGTFDPKIKNPTSSARGLIQFMDSTASRVFGVSDSLTLINKYPTFESQMYNAVLPYLQQFEPFPTKQSLYMAVFYPAARNSPPSTVFNATVRKANPGIVTVQDYVDLVDGKKPKGNAGSKMMRLLVIAVVVIGAFTMGKERSSRNS